MKYVAYYDTPDNKAEGREYQLSAADKVNYICRTLNRLGHPVQIISPCVTANRKGCKGKIVPVFDQTTLKRFPCLGMGGLAKRILRRILTRIRLFCELVFHTKKQETVLVYHSLASAGTIALARMVKDFRLILEVEEIYADVTGNEVDRRWEYRLFSLADAFLFPTQLLNEKVNTHGKPYGIIHGTYQAEPDRGERLFDDEKIHCVYAGTFDPRKGGVVAAAAAAEFLPENYHIHLLGFGTEEEVAAVQELVKTCADRCTCSLTYDGLLAGEDYIRFIQSCQIGLSTQNPAAAFNGTSFPSKILSYMANGLHVVSIRIPVVEQSAIGGRVTYYEQQTPEKIARAILSVDFGDGEEPRVLLEKLNRSFEQEMEELLSQ